MSFLLSLARRQPLRFAMAYGGAKTVLADAIVQRYVERREELDRRRLGVFLTFGLFQVGFVQYQLYVNTFSRLFTSASKFAAVPLRQKLTDIPGMRNVVAQVMLDQAVYHPLCYFPVFYCCNEIVQGEASGLSDLVHRSLTAYRPNMMDDLKSLWSIFVPVSIVQFSVMPMHLRVPFAATAGFVWCGILSSMRGAQLAGDPACIATEEVHMTREGLLDRIRGRSSSSKPGVL